MSTDPHSAFPPDGRQQPPPNPYQAPPQQAQYQQPQYQQPQYQQPQYQQAQYPQPQYPTHGVPPQGWSTPPGGPQTVLRPSPPLPGRRTSRTTAAIAGGVAGVVVIGAGAVFGLSALSGGGERADVALPDSAIAAVTIDLDPSAGQKVDALRFASAFPRTQDLDWDSADQNPRRWLYERAFAGVGDAPPWAQVEPWLGDRAGLALLPAAGQGEPNVVVALQVKDLDAAKASVASMAGANGSPVGVAGEDDWMILAESDAEAAAAYSAAKQAPLAESAVYASDVDALGEQGVANLWVDNAALGRALGTTMGAAAAVSGSAQLTGRSAATLRFTGGHLELVGRATGQRDQMPSGDPVELAAPSEAVAVVAVAGLGDLVAAQWDSTLAQMPGLDVSDAESATGLRLPEDLVALLGRQATMAVAGHDADPAVGVRVLSDDPGLDDALSRLRRALLMLGAPSTISPTRTDDGYVLEVGSTPSGLAQGGDLASSGAFTEAVPDASDAQALAYVDLARAADLAGPVSEQDRELLQSLQAVGFSVALDGDDAVRFRLRLTTG